MKYLKLYKEHIDWDDFDDEENDDDQFIDFPEYLSNKDAIGKKVKIKPGTRWDSKGKEKDNPDITGTIISQNYNENDLIFRVLWDNERTNSYGRPDLIIKI